MCLKSCCESIEKERHCHPPGAKMAQNRLVVLKNAFNPVLVALNKVKNGTENLSVELRMDEVCCKCKQSLGH